MDYSKYLPEIIKRIVSLSQPEKVILFGSYARGDHEPDSDLDLLINMKQVASPRAESNRLRKALRGKLVPIDLIVVPMDHPERNRHTPGYVYQTALAEG